MEKVSAVRKVETGVSRLTNATQVASALVDIITPDAPKKARTFMTDEIAIDLLKVLNQHSDVRPYSNRFRAGRCVEDFYKGKPTLTKEEESKTKPYVQTFFENEFNILFP